MNTEVKKSIEALKVVVLDRYRLAGCLDALIQSIEMEFECTDSSECLKMFVQVQRNYYHDLKEARNLMELDKRERKLFESIINELSKKES